MQAIQVLEEALHASPATIVTAEPFLFNLCECRAHKKAGSLRLISCANQLYSYALRAALGSGGRQEARAPHRGRQVGRGRAAHDLPQAAHHLG